MTYYNLTLHNDTFRMTKFDADLNVESSYELTATDCACPQAHRPTCRHRKMFPIFMASGHVNDNWFYNFERETFEKLANEEPASEAPEGLFPEGTTCVSLADPMPTIVHCVEIPIDKNVAEEFSKLLTAPQAWDANTIPTTLAQDVMTGHASREDEEAYAACAPNRADTQPLRRRL